MVYKSITRVDNNNSRLDAVRDLSCFLEHTSPNQHTVVRVISVDVSRLDTVNRYRNNSSTVGHGVCGQ